MPHQCTNCGDVFADGSKEMLSGCPSCGGNKFQFHPSSEDVPDEPAPSAEPPEPPGPDSTVAKTVGNAAATVRDMVSGSDSTGAPETEAGPPDQPPAPAEDTAQADARSEVVGPDEIPSSDGWSPTDEESAASAVEAGTTETPTSESPTAEEPTAEHHGPSGPDGRVVDEPDEDRPDLSELRQELNEQFESIKVLSPGQYELNLMELYDREEYIIALQEDGRYTIQVPETWHD